MIEKEKKSARSYDAHEQHIQAIFNKGEDRLFILRNKNCVAYMMGVRPLEILSPLLKEKNKWLTIGDHTGFEAKYLAEQNQDATASDLSDVY